MKFLPFESIIYQTKLTKEQAKKKLSDSIEPKTWRIGSFRKPTTKTYEGEIDEDCFNIQRIILYRNSFLPTITGSIHQDRLGTTIKVNMRLDILVTVLLLLSCIFLGPLGIASLLASITDKDFNNQTFIPLTVLLFIYSIIMIGFKTESKKSKKYLQHLFEAHIIP